MRAIYHNNLDAICRKLSFHNPSYTLFVCIGQYAEISKDDANTGSYYVPNALAISLIRIEQWTILDMVVWLTKVNKLMQYHWKRTGAKRRLNFYA